MQRATLDGSALGDIHEDLVDMLLLVVVFIFGWLLFSKISLRWSTPRSHREVDLAKKLQTGWEDLGQDPWPADPQAVAAAGVGSAAGVDFEEIGSGGALDLASFFPCESLPTTKVAAPTWPRTAAADPAEADARLGELACAGDLEACWRLWRSLPAGSVPGPATCAALAAALGRFAAASADDAEGGLQVALAAAHADLAHAALAAGACVRPAAWLEEAGRRLQAAGLPAPASFPVLLARAHGHDGRVDLAADLWFAHRAALGDAGVGADLFAVVFEACGNARDFALAARLARAADWRAPYTPAGQVAMLGTARWLARRRALRPARRCLDAAKAAGAVAGLPTLRALIAAAAAAGDLPQAGELFEDLRASGLHPDFSVCASMIRGHCAAGNLSDALCMLQEMCSLGIRPDATIFDALWGAFARAPTTDAPGALEARLLEAMRRAAVPPSSACLAALVRVRAARGGLDEAQALFKSLPELHGFRPDARAYHALITACVAGRRLQDALAAFAELSASGQLAAAKTYEKLIAACAQHGDLDGAATLVEDALGGPSPAAAGDAEAASPAIRAWLDKKACEELLRLVGRSGEARRLGQRLLTRFERVGLAVSEPLADAVRRAAADEASGTSPQSFGDVRRQRCLEWRRWQGSFAR